MEPNKTSNTTTQFGMLEHIARLERFAATSQSYLTGLGKGVDRDRVVLGLATLDRLIATHKDSTGCLGLDDCSYLDD